MHQSSSTTSPLVEISFKLKLFCNFLQLVLFFCLPVHSRFLKLRTLIYMYIHTITPLSPYPIRALVICKQVIVTTTTTTTARIHENYTTHILIYNEQTPENKEKSETLQNNTLLEARFHKQQHLNSNILPKMTKIGSCTRD